MPFVDENSSNGELTASCNVFNIPPLNSGVYRSGQTGQTVNLMALPSQVRILSRPIIFLAYRRQMAFLAIFGQKRH